MHPPPRGAAPHSSSAYSTEGFKALADKIDTGQVSILSQSGSNHNGECFRRKKLSERHAALA